jgi:hypothetical protein
MKERRADFGGRPWTARNSVTTIYVDDEKWLGLE